MKIFETNSILEILNAEVKWRNGSKWMKCDPVDCTGVAEEGEKLGRLCWTDEPLAFTVTMLHGIILLNLSYQATAPACLFHTHTHTHTHTQCNQCGCYCKFSRYTDDPHHSTRVLSTPHVTSHCALCTAVHHTVCSTALLKLTETLLYCQ